MKRKVSFENTKRLLDRSLKVNDIIQEAFMNDLDKTREDVIHEVNKAVYEMAEKNRMSIWDVCFRCIPEYTYSDPIFTENDPNTPFVELKGCVKLVPLELELEKGPDYWEGRYRKLKNEIQNVLDDETRRDRE